MKIIYDDGMDKEISNNLKIEANVFYSEKYNSFLMSDNIFKDIDKKYDISNYDVNYYIYDNLENWVETYFDGDKIEFFDRTYSLTDFAETVNETIKFETNEDINEFGFISIDNNDWAVDVKEYLKSSVMIYVNSELQDQLKTLYEDGYDINILKESFHIIEMLNKNK